MNHHFLNKVSLRQWRVFYLLAALFIACKVMYNQHGWVNNDSLLYFEQARLIANGDFQQAFDLYSWIFYPALVSLIHTITSLDIQTSAQCLNAVCFVLFVAGFQQLLLEAGAKLRTIHWAHLLLFSTQYITGDVLSMLLRDQGFWAAYTWGLSYWLRSLKAQRWQDVFLFQCAMVMATLFRIESSAYLLALPLCILFYQTIPWPKKAKLLLQANTVTLLAIVIIGIPAFLGLLNIQHIGRLQEVLTQVTTLFSERINFINQKAEVISKQVLGEDLDQYGSFSLWASLILIAVLKTLKSAGLPALLVIVWPKQTWWSKLPEHTKHLAIATLAISFTVSLVIIFNVFVLSSRYVIASGIIMLLLAAFAITEWQNRWPRWGGTFYAILLASLLSYSLWDKNDIDLDRLAVNYIQSINSQHKPVFYDTENARFYAQQPYIDRVLGRVLFPQLISNNDIDKYDYYMITISKDDVDIAYEQQALTTLPQHRFKLEKTIYGWRKKSKVLIFSKQAVPN